MDRYLGLGLFVLILPGLFAIVFIILLLALLLFNGSLVPASEWNVFSADIITMVGFFLVGILLPFASPELWQRVYSAKGKKEVKAGLLWSIVPYGIVAFLLSLIALTVKVSFPNIDPDLALIYGFANLLPPGLLGLSVVLLFGAVMSSVDTYIFTASSAIVQDFSISNKQKTVKDIKKIIFTISLVALITAILIQSIIIGTFIFVAIVMVLAVPVIATWIKRDIKEETLIFGFTIGLILSAAYTIFSLIKGNIEPTIIVVALGSTILGLLIGGIFSMIKR